LNAAFAAFRAHMSNKGNVTLTIPAGDYLTSSNLHAFIGGGYKCKIIGAGKHVCSIGHAPDYADSGNTGALINGPVEVSEITVVDGGVNSALPLVSGR